MSNISPVWLPQLHCQPGQGENMKKGVSVLCASKLILSGGPPSPSRRASTKRATPKPTDNFFSELGESRNGRR